MASALLARLQANAGQTEAAPRVEPVRKRAVAIELPATPPRALAPPPALEEEVQPEIYVSRTPEPVTTPHRVARVTVQSRPASIEASHAFFGSEGAEQLLGYLQRCLVAEEALNQMALAANRWRVLGVGLCMALSAASAALSASPICAAPGAGDPEDPCQNNVMSVSAALSAGAALVLGVLEKGGVRKQAPRLRDLSAEYAALAREIRQTLFVSPPESTSAGAYLKRLAVKFGALEARAPHIPPRLARKAEIVAQKSLSTSQVV